MNRHLLRSATMIFGSFKLVEEVLQNPKKARHWAAAWEAQSFHRMRKWSVIIGGYNFVAAGYCAVVSPEHQNLLAGLLAATSCVNAFVAYRAHRRLEEATAKLTQALSEPEPPVAPGKRRLLVTGGKVIDVTPAETAIPELKRII